MSEQKVKRVKILIGKPGLDGHDRGAKVIARAFRDAGHDVIYTGLHQTPEMIVNAALDEDVDAIGLSILSGAHTTLVKKIVELLKEKDGAGIKLFVGGIIPKEDFALLEELGVQGIFTPGAGINDVVEKVVGTI